MPVLELPVVDTPVADPNVKVYWLTVLVKFAVIVVAPVIVPLLDDQLLNVVVYPVAAVALAVTLAPFENVKVLPFVLYVVPCGTFATLAVDTVP